MFIIKWFKSDNEYYYSVVNSIYGARCDTPPNICSYYVGYVNGFNHEIIDIMYVSSNRVITYEEYNSFNNFKYSSSKEKIINKLINYLVKLKE